jgi:predicted dehydrogenase
MTPIRQTTRRQFLGATGALTTTAVLGFPAIVRARSPGESLNVAVIGVGGRGASNLGEMTGENVVALCDVNERNLDAAAQRHPQAKKFLDYRRLYDEVKNLEAVVVSCAEHTHAFAVLPALQLRKHVYCEKPLSHSVWEARLLTEEARRAKVATQMGTQIHAGTNYRRVVELRTQGLCRLN